jgi:hypothetical protein
MKLRQKEIHINNEFEEINREFKTLYDCKMSKNGALEDCDIVSH